MCEPFEKRNISYTYRDSNPGPPGLEQRRFVCVIVCTATIQPKYFLH